MRAAALAGVISLAAGSALAEDLVVVARSSTAGKPDETITSYFAAAGFRLSTSQMDLVYYSANGRYTMIDHKRKTYSDTFQATLAALSERSGGKPAGTVVDPAAAKVVKGPSGRTIVGFECEEYLVTMGDRAIQLWVTTALDRPPNLFPLAPPPGVSGAATKWAEAMRAIPGVALAQRETATTGGKTSTTSWEATEVRKQALPTSAFEAPAGYRKLVELCGECNSMLDCDVGLTCSPFEDRKKRCAPAGREVYFCHGQ